MAGVLIGAEALGLANLAANWVIAEAEPRLRALLAERMATLDPREAVVASPIWRKWRYDCSS
jgi:hypothetical protein